MKLTKLIYVGRHGQRAPLDIPNIYKNDWNEPGFLCTKGAETQYNRGVQFREKHKDFINSLLPENIYCQTSNRDRTIDSAFCLIRGILGLPFVSPFQFSRSEKIEKLEKFKLNPRPIECDALYSGYDTSFCPGAAKLYDSLIREGIERKEHFDTLIPIMPLVKRLFGVDEKYPVDYKACLKLYDLLECYNANDKKFPKGFEDGEMHKKIRFLHYYDTYNIRFKSEIMRRLSNHYIYKEFIKIISGTSTPSFHYYSSHDVNIFAIILGLGYNINEVPFYSTGFTVELYELGKERFVNLDYKGQNINRNVSPNLRGKYIPIDNIVAKLNKECFGNHKEYMSYCKNPSFDYKRDYLDYK